MADASDTDALWAAFAETQDPQLLEALMALYAPLAKYLARRALVKAPAWQSADDILSFAHHGLLDAIMKFEPGRVKFETYATQRIAGAIIDGQRRDDPLGRSMRKQVKEVEAASNRLWEKLGRDPSSAEIAAHLEVDEATVREARAYQKSLVASLDADDGIEQRQATDDGAEISALMAQVRSRVSTVLAGLPAELRALALAHYIDGLSVKTLAERIGMSHHWVRRGRHSIWSRL